MIKNIILDNGDIIHNVNSLFSLNTLLQWRDKK